MAAIISRGGASILLACLAAGCPPAEKPGHVGTATCLGCHNGTNAPDVSFYPESAHFLLGVGCEDCHGPGEQHVRNAGRGGLFIYNPHHQPFETAYESCTGCHADVAGEYLQSAHYLKGAATCYTCHTVHRRDAWYLPVEDNRICMFCHGQTDFPDEDAVTAHTFHENDPLNGASQCVGCHMTPLSRFQTRSTPHSHTWKARPPIFSNLAMDAGVTPTPANSCAGVTGCHDGTREGAPFFDVDDPQSNADLQAVFEFRYPGATKRLVPLAKVRD